MKKVILLVWFLPAMAFGQILENFESGSVAGWVQSIPGRWSADTITPLAGKYSLHHSFDNPDAGSDETGLKISDLKPAMGIVKWTFCIRHGSDPSSSNNWAVFIMSDSPPGEMHPGGNVNGFALGVNLAGSDDTLRLWKIKSGSCSVIITSKINWQNNIGTTGSVIAEVERTQQGNWTLKLNTASGSDFGTFSGYDSEMFNSAWFGILYRYTSTRDRLLWFDDLRIDGTFIPDNDAPVITQCNLSGRNSLELTLDEQPDPAFSLVSNFVVNGNNPSSVVLKLPGNTFKISFQYSFLNKEENNLLVKSLCDLNSNCSLNTTLPFEASWSDQGDVVITEIMADPVPRVSLPEKEYIEVANVTQFTLNLKNWNLYSTVQQVLIPETQIKPGEYLIFCSVSDTSEFLKYGKVVGLKSFPVLNDEGKMLMLSDSSGKMIHGVEYTSDWYGDQMKSKGGWSLEMIDSHFPFFMKGNWKASNSRDGGTPGSANSVSADNRDIIFTGLVNAFPVDPSSIKVTFSESAKEPESLSEGITLNGLQIKSISRIDPLQREYNITLHPPMKEKLIYTLTFPSSFCDFAGNQAQRNTINLGLPDIAGKNDIVFNELLFNPLPGDADYIELYNNSGKVIDVSQLSIASLNAETGDTSEPVPLSAIARCILPGGYYVSTALPEEIIKRYFSATPENIFLASQMPGMADDKGHLILLNRNLDLIDEVKYDDEMHFSLLSGDEGVALEKIRPQLSSLVAESWHSASETSGWGTPGSPNSVFIEEPDLKDKIKLSSTKISPDNDGYEDILVIDLKLEGTGNVVSVTVFDENGQPVKRVAENMLAGSEDSLTWNGTADDGSLVRRGLYVFYISVYNTKGKTEKWKKVCSVVR